MACAVAQARLLLQLLVTSDPVPSSVANASGIAIHLRDARSPKTVWVAGGKEVAIIAGKARLTHALAVAASSMTRTAALAELCSTGKVSPAYVTVTHSIVAGPVAGAVERAERHGAILPRPVR